MKMTQKEMFKSTFDAYVEQINFIHEDRLAVLTGLIVCDTSEEDGIPSNVEGFREKSIAEVEKTFNQAIGMLDFAYDLEIIDEDECNALFQELETAERKAIEALKRASIETILH